MPYLKLREAMCCGLRKGDNVTVLRWMREGSTQWQVEMKYQVVMFLMFRDR